MKIEAPMHLLIGGREMSIGKSDPIIFLSYLSKGFVLTAKEKR